jgi:hypothetical protein
MNDNTGGKLTEAISFARKIKDASLIQCLKDLKSAEKNDPGMTTHLANDFAPRSFYFERFKDGIFKGNGGIIYHGPKGEFQSGAPTFSTCIGKPNAWEIHT